MSKRQRGGSERSGPRAVMAVGLREPLSQALNAYAVAAVAAGVTVVACSMPAEAAPICKSLNGQITRTSSFAFSPTGQFVPPFNVAQTTFKYFLGTTGVSTWIWLNRGFFSPNTVGAKVLLGIHDLPAGLAYGDQIGPGGQFSKGRSYGLLFTYGKGNFSVGGGTKLKHRGHMSFEHDNFVGFQFSQSGSVHYGWLRLSLAVLDSKSGGNFPKVTSIHLTSYGYESASNTAIAAGSCSAEASSSDDVSGPSAGPSLGMLALGSEGISAWRKR